MIRPPDGDELLVVVGPTASGKTELALRLCEELGGEVIGADSVQIYRHFDIGSGKPTAEELARAPHHLVGVVDPLEAIDAKVYADMADLALAEVRGRARVPIVCGGTFLWVKALVSGLAATPPADPEVRERHAALVAREGRPALHAALLAVDPDAAARLSPNDFVRVSRALEVYELTGRQQSSFHAEHGFRVPRHRARLLGVERPREELDERIRRRTEAWLAAGWIDEVKSLSDRGYAEARAMASVGYRQVRDHLRGELPRDELVDAIVRATRVFARRQRTWLRDQPVEWMRP